MTATPSDAQHTRKRATGSTALGCGLLLIAAGCTPPKRQSTRVTIRAESDPGVALRNVAITHDGLVIGASDDEGWLPLTLSGPIGQVVGLEVRCPAGFRVASPQLQVALRPNEDSARLPEYRVLCSPERRQLVVSLRAPNAAGVPVRYLGHVIARTDADGIAHSLLELPPGEEAQLLLDTSGPEHRALRPKNPVLQLTVPDHDEIVSLEQPFAVIVPKQPAPKAIELPVHF
jgi:hypothetical protein